MSLGLSGVETKMIPCSADQPGNETATSRKSPYLLLYSITFILSQQRTHSYLLDKTDEDDQAVFTL